MERRVLKYKKEYLTDLFIENIYLRDILDNNDVAKISLAMLYLGEGKKGGYCLSFANTNPKVISLYLNLLFKCYAIEKDKLRLTVQCRADQSIEELENFWYAITNIPKVQFYKAQVDPRTIGKPTRKIGYKGVCRIDYLSSYFLDDLMQTIAVLSTGP